LFRDSNNGIREIGEGAAMAGISYLLALLFGGAAFLFKPTTGALVPVRSSKGRNRHG
jgi:hypothetical protein